MSWRERIAAWGLLLALAACAGAPQQVAEPEPEAPPTVQAPDDGLAGEVPGESLLGEASRAQRIAAYAARARQALASKDYRQAAEAAREASLLDPSLAETRLVEAEARQAMGDLTGALGLWQEAARQGQGGLGALAAYASLAVRRGEGEAAYGVLDERTRQDPGNPELHGLTGWLALSIGRDADARRHLEQTWDTEAMAAYALLTGRARWLQGDFAGALRAAELARRSEETPAAWLLAGDAHRGLGMAGAAEQAYRRALELDPDEYSGRINLGVLLLGQGKAGEAAELFRSAAEQRPGAPAAWNNLGLARREQGNLQAAREAYEKALESVPGHREALKNLGILNEKYLGRPAAALPYYDRYLEQWPEDEDVARWRKTAERLATETGGGG